MGNGRYYTFRQFFEIAYLTAASGVTVYTLTYIWIKSRDKARAAKYVLGLCGLLFYFLISFIKEVAYGFNEALVLTGISYCGIFLFFLVGLYGLNFWQKSALMLVGSIISIVISVEGNEFSFFYHQISPWYVLVIGSLYMGIVANHLPRLMDGNRKSFQTKADLIILIGYTYLLLMLGLVSFSHMNGISIQYSALVQPFLFLFVFLKFMPGEKIPLGYHSAIEGMLDTMIIISPDREILFVNQTKFSDYIIRDRKVDLRHLEDLFKIQNKQVVRMGEYTIQVNGRGDGALISLLVCLKPIEKDGQVLGYIIVTTDCTDLELMIVELKGSKEELKAKEKELLLYASTVKTLTGEKERHRLMQDVQNQLGHHLAELTAFLLNTKNKALSEEGDHILGQIETAILMARRSLAKIRETVVEYRETYEGKE